MLAVGADTVPRDDDRWAYEMKWDGMRALVVVEDGVVSVTSRTGKDATVRFPELAGLGEALGEVDAVLDGEIVALDDAGIPSFERLQPRMQAGSAAAARRLAPEQPVVLMLFDVLWLAGRSTCALRVHRAPDAPRTARAGGPVLADAADHHRRRPRRARGRPTARPRRRGGQARSTAPTSRAAGPTPGAR